jgi:hypothetical protein
LKKSLFVEITIGGIILSFILHENALAWTEKTHENLSVYAVEESVLPDYLSWTLAFENGLQEIYRHSANTQRYSLSSIGNLQFFNYSHCEPL